MSSIVMLLLSQDAAQTNEEIQNLFDRAGYTVVQIHDVDDYYRHFKTSSSASLYSPSLKFSDELRLKMDANYSIENTKKEVAIFDSHSMNSESFGIRQPYELYQTVSNFTRKIFPGWRVSLCKRSLESPQGLRVDLTSLEFEFLKIFSMADVGESISRKKIVQAFNEDYLLYDQNRLDTLVRRLRQKIKLQLGVELPLNTVRIKGFSFDEVLILDR